ncbi:hypothetical protein DFH06DRAFT_1142527 [Mycena polygramma]|nr:hypothetical protein DFH06DRAFT_1142527 [Mycena polygramma]
MDPPSEFPANDIPDEMHNEYANCSPDNMSDMSDELINMHFRSELPDIPDELPYELANAIPDDRSDAPDDLILDTEAEFWQGQERSLEADLSSSAASSSFLDLPAELDPATADTLSLDEPLRMVSTTELRAFAMKYLEPTDEVPPYLESFWPTLVLEKSLLDFAEFLSDENYIGKDYAFTIRKTSGQAPTAYCLVLEPNPNGPDLSSFGPLTNQMDFQANYDILHQIMQGVQADGFSGLVLGLSDVSVHNTTQRASRVPDGTSQTFGIRRARIVLDHRHRKALPVVISEQTLPGDRCPLRATYFNPFAL